MKRERERMCQLSRGRAADGMSFDLIGTWFGGGSRLAAAGALSCAFRMDGRASSLEPGVWAADGSGYGFSRTLIPSK